ncbi:MAG: 4Fe-4S dicluster domain-containing protein [Candidatus Omnitrophota bacterium]
MKYLYLRKEDLAEFVKYLKKSYKVVAPVKKENQFVFADIEDPGQMCLEYLPTILPPKKYFFPQEQKLGSFKMGEVSMSKTAVEIEPMVIFGVHTCDIEGIECLDVVFNDTPPDPYFRKRKKNIFLIGYECMKMCDEYATCVAMDTHIPKAGYDIMITAIDDKYILYVNSREADELVKKCPLFEKDLDDSTIKAELDKARKAKLVNFKTPLEAGFKELNKIFKKSYDSKVWEDVGKRCVSCGNCTAVCPTCYCFDIYDEVKLDMSGGDRKRVWDSCQLEDFAVVAGGENFRKERSSRQRHRYYRKFDYPVSKHNKFFCVGCGRCTRTCMADISLIETVNDLTKEHKDEK